MILRDTDFGSVFNASGARGFFGEGYPFHKWSSMVPGFTFDGTTFVAKTTTLLSKKGNMPLKEDGITPKNFKPKCIVVKPSKGVVLNAVGLSGPGAEWLLNQRRWQERTEPFFLSFMSVEQSAEKRLDEAYRFVELLLGYKDHYVGFKAPFGLKINVSCPNIGLHVEELAGEVNQILSVASALDVPLIPKFNILLPPEVACEIAEHPFCDGICVSNTIPYGEIPETINWRKLFGRKSPLEDYGGGGLSGKPLLPLVEEWVTEARLLGMKKPIIAGGGVLEPNQAIQLLIAGADAVSLGTMAILRPWRMRETIETIHKFMD